MAVKNPHLKIAVVLCALIALLWIGYQPRLRPPISGEGVQNSHFLSDPPPSTLKIGVYNIYRGRGTDGIVDLQRTANVLGHADLVSLHEVAGAIPLWSRDQAAMLADFKRMAYIFSPVKTRFLFDSSGNGLLTRVAIGAWQEQPLPQTYPTFRRYLLADLKWKGRLIKLISTHIDLHQDRELQLNRVLGEFKKYNPSILIGDLNSRRNDPALRRFIETGEATDAVHTALTDVDEKPGVDWILTRGFKVLGGGYVPVGVSDHPYYWVELDLTQ